MDVMNARTISLLVDLRCKPYGRLREFNKNALLRVLGFRYQWRGDTLGGFCGPVPPEALGHLVTLFHSPINTLIMCMEHDPRKCHRYQDIGKRLLIDHSIDVIHIIGDREYTTNQLNQEV
jgi:hypothetical protein